MRHLLFFTLQCATIPAGAARITYTDHPILSAYDGSMRLYSVTDQQRTHSRYSRIPNGDILLPIVADQHE